MYHAKFLNHAGSWEYHPKPFNEKIDYHDVTDCLNLTNYSYTQEGSICRYWTGEIECDSRWDIPPEVLSFLPRKGVKMKGPLGYSCMFKVTGDREYFFNGKPITKIPEGVPVKYQTEDISKYTSKSMTSLLEACGIRCHHTWKMWNAKMHPDKNKHVDPKLASTVNGLFSESQLSRVKNSTICG